MKDLIFRGRRLDNGEWVTGGSILQLMNNGTPEAYIVGSGTLCVDTHEEDTGNIVGLDACLFCKVDPETVGQYIGMKDKERNLIFEGDVISAHFDEFDPDDETILYIKWCSFMWNAVEPAHECAPDPVFESDGELWTVIGNIHDNPELIGIDGKEMSDGE